MSVAHRVLREQIDHQPGRLGTWFTPLGHWIAGAVALALILALGVAHIGAVHEARAARQEACAARLEAWKARNPLLANGLMPVADACANLALLVGKP